MRHSSSLSLPATIKSSLASFCDQEPHEFMSRSRVKTEQLVSNSSRGLVVRQVVRVDQPSILTSGLYHCKVATFTTEEISTHNLLIFGKLGQVAK